MLTRSCVDRSIRMEERSPSAIHWDAQELDRSLPCSTSLDELGRRWASQACVSGLAWVWLLSGSKSKPCEPWYSRIRVGMYDIGKKTARHSIPTCIRYITVHRASRPTSTTLAINEYLDASLSIISDSTCLDDRKGNFGKHSRRRRR